MERRLKSQKPGIVVAGLCLVFAFSAQAATIYVTDNRDGDQGGVCTLKEAIDAANADASGTTNCTTDGVAFGSDTIILHPGTYPLGTTIALAATLPQITDTLTIQGPDANDPSKLTIDGQGLVRLIELASDSAVYLTLKALTLTNGYTSGNGAAINLRSGSTFGTLRLEDVVASNNQADARGGAISFQADSNATLELVNSRFENNVAITSTTATGGAVYVGDSPSPSAAVTIAGSNFQGNFASIYSGTGGAIVLDNPQDVVITDSAFIGNAAGHRGGAISITSTNLFTLTNSTFSDNVLWNYSDLIPFGGAIYLPNTTTLDWHNLTFNNNIINRNTYGESLGSAVYFGFGFPSGTISNITVAGNSATYTNTNGHAVAMPGAGVTIRNSVISGNSPGNCYAFATDGGYNLESGIGCGFTTNGYQNSDPLLKPLADNGGPVQTMAPSFGSPLIDAANPAGCLDHSGAAITSDARGAPRVDGDDLDTTVTCDIGAYEFGGIGAVAMVATTTSLEEKAASIFSYQLKRYGNLQPFSTTITTQDGTAIGGGDFNAYDSSVTWLLDVTTLNRSVAILADQTAEPHESFSVTQGSTTPGVDLGDPVTFTITEPVISLASATVSATESAGSHTITIELDATYTQNVEVFFTIDGTATGGGVDYSPPSFMTVYAGDSSADYTLFINDDALDEGDEEVTITLLAPAAFGTLGSVASQTLIITDDDTTPVGDYSPNPAEVDEDPAVPLTITLSATDADGDTAFSYTITAQPAHGQLGGSGADRSYTPDGNFSGSDSFTFTVDDGTNTSGEVTVAITVNPVADAPVITSDASVEVVENQSAVTTVTASDDDGDAVTFTLSGGADAALFGITSGGVLTFKSARSFEEKLDANGDGIYLVEVTATDASASHLTGAQTLAVTVTNVNEAPVGAVTIDGIAEEDQTLTADTSGLSDDDGLGTLHYQWQSGGTNVGGDSASYTLGDSDVGNTVSVTVSYTDNGGTPESVSSGTTPAVTNINDAPTLSGTPATLVLEGAAYSFTPTAGDVDAGDTLTFSVSNNPAWLTINPSSGLLSGTPQRGDIGTTSGIIVTVSDAVAESSLPPFDLTVAGDLDRDGISDTADSDDDGDGVADSGGGGGGGGGAMAWFSLVALPLLWRRRKGGGAA